MVKLFFRFIFLCLALIAADYFVAGIYLSGVTSLVMAGALLTLINVIVKPVVKILTLPITIITLGLFALVLNALFFWFVSGLVSGMTVDSFTAALIGGILVSVLNWFADRALK